MKKNILVLFWLMASCAGYSQKLYLSPLLEKTVAGPQYGLSSTFQLKSGWGIGGFYQFSLQKQTDAVNPSNTYFGLTVNAPLARTEKLNLYGNARMGLVNKQFFVMVPGLETEINIYKHISLSALMSMRMSYPSAGVKINMKI